MLAYVFWHRPQPEVSAGEYEEAQRSFQETLAIDSACFRLDRLPFSEEPGYEDWYLVDDWRALGDLNERAVDAVRRESHGRAAVLSAHGWGGVYAAVKGAAAIPDGADWREKPVGEQAEEFIAALPGDTVWQRQLVLGPAPEFCAAVADPSGRERIWPSR